MLEQRFVWQSLFYSLILDTWEADWLEDGAGAVDPAGVAPKVLAGRMDQGVRKDSWLDILHITNAPNQQVQKVLYLSSSDSLALAVYL